MEVRNVIVAGPNGSLGEAIIANLLKAGFNVSALTRNLAVTRKAFPDVHPIEANYDTVEELTKALKSGNTQFDAVVSLINRQQVQAQNNLTDAAVAAGIPHIIPSCFGADMGLPEVRAIPALKGKIEMESHVLQQAQAGAITFTGINTAILFDWALGANFLLNLASGQSTTLYDGGDCRVSISAHDTVGQAIVKVLQHRQQYTNKFINIHSAVVTQNQLLKYVREAAPGRVFETVDVNISENFEMAQKKIAEGDQSMANMRWSMIRVLLDDRYGVFKRTQNETLGIQMWNEDLLRAMVAKYV